MWQNEENRQERGWPTYAAMPQKKWRQRHPVLFWGGVILLVLFSLGLVRRTFEQGPLSGPKIGVVHVQGMILDVSPVIDWIETLRLDPSVKGVLLRINSPGGAVEPSEELYMAVARLAKYKPVVASMGATAASGGYYAALGADEIVAGPSTLTASIGVKFEIPNAEVLMRMVGLSSKTLTTGSLKDAGSPLREMTAEEEAYFRALITDMYDGFVNVVAERRKLSREKVLALADGRAMTGRQALQAGLVDQIGDAHAALERLRERCNLLGYPSTRLLEGPEKPMSLLKELAGAVLQWQQEQQAAVGQARFMY